MPCRTCVFNLRYHAGPRTCFSRRCKALPILDKAAVKQEERKLLARYAEVQFLTAGLGRTLPKPPPSHISNPSIFSREPRIPLLIGRTPTPHNVIRCAQPEESCNSGGQHLMVKISRQDSEDKAPESEKDTHLVC